MYINKLTVWYFLFIVQDIWKWCSARFLRLSDCLCTEWSRKNCTEFNALSFCNR